MNKNPRHPIASIIQHWGLLRQLVIRGINTRYQASALGLVWAVIHPICLLCIYTFVFNVIFKMRLTGEGIEDSKLSFALSLLCGLATYNIFSESISVSTISVSGNPNYVKKVVFPLELLPLSTLLTSFFFGAIWFLITIAGILVFMQKFCITSISLPLVLLPLIFFACGVCWFVAALGVFVRDLPAINALVLQMLFYLSPIFYPVSAVPEPYRFALYLNPLATIIGQVRGALLLNQWPDWWLWAGLLTASVLVAQLGFSWFMWIKKGFADVL